MRKGLLPTVSILAALYLALAPPLTGEAAQYYKAVYGWFYLLTTATIPRSRAAGTSTPRQAAAQTQFAPPVNPFVDGLSIQYTASLETVFVQQVDGTYANLELNPTTKTAVSPTSVLNQAFSGGIAAMVNAPAVPAGTGVQSQSAALSRVLGNGNAAVTQAGSDDASVVISQTSVTASVTVPIGPDVNSVLFADFNNDGNPDLAVAFDGSNTVPGGIAILLGKSDGTFASPVIYASGTQATNFAVLDLDHDGVLDIATVSLSQMVTVLLGKGDGTFSAPMKYSVGGSGQAIAIADFNGDGNPDIAVGGTAGILLGNGDGTFRAGTPLPAAASGTQIWAFAAGDLNGDGKMDLVYADITNQVLVPMFGNGNGTFNAGQAYTVSQLPDFIVLADYNHDGRLDIINGGGDQRVFGGADNSANTDILLNNGDGTFAGAPAYFALPNSETTSGFSLIRGMALGKFGGSATGLVALSVGEVTLFEGNGKGGFQAPQAISLSGPAQAVVSADFNGDGIADAAIATGSNVAILIGNSTGFATPTLVPFGGSNATALAAADFDGDGKIDLAVMGSGTPGVLAFLKGNGDGTFHAPVVIPAGATPTSIAAADLNGDGKPDIVFADSGTNGFGGAIFAALNAGGGAFQTPVSVFTGTYPTFSIGDVNLDGKLDLVAASSAVGGVVSWLAGNGNGTFQAAAVIDTSDDRISAVLVQDFNGDGKPDVTIAQPDEDTIFLAGNGDGTFSPETHLLAGAQPSFLETADLNGDGKPDLVVGGLTLNVLLNRAVPLATTVNSASFTPPVAVGSIASAFGTDLANGAALSDTTFSVTDAADVTQQCTLFYVSPSQVNFLIPPTAAAGLATLTVTSGDGTVSQGSLNLTATAPGVYTANGVLAAALSLVVTSAGQQTTTVLVSANSSGNLVTAPIGLDPPSNSVYLILYGTGIRGAALSQVSVQVGGQTLAPAYAGQAPGYPGEDQVNVLLPYSLKGSGNTAVTVTVAGQAANTVHIQIQ